MSTARSALEDRIEYAVDQQLAASGTATSGGSTTVLDTGRPSSGEDFTHWWIHIDEDAGGKSAAPEGEERVISVYTASSRTFTVPIAFSAQPAVGDTYSVRRSFGKKMIGEAINHGIEEGLQNYLDVNTDETIRILTDIHEYSVPTGAIHIYQIWLRKANDLDSGTASAGATSTLTDSTKGWTTNEFASQEVVIYDGTAAGAYKTILSNTDTILTISSSGSADWTANPDDTSKYRIKEVVAHPGWERINIAQIDIPGAEFRFPGQLTEGEALRVMYHKEYAILTTDIATPGIPANYVVYKALAFLWRSRVGDAKIGRIGAEMAAYYDELAEKYARQHPQVLPTDTMWLWPGRGGWTTGPFVASGSAGEV